VRYQPIMREKEHYEQGGYPMNKLSDFIREKRLDEAMTQQEFAGRLGITNVTLSGIENGKRIGAKTLKILGEYLQMPTKELRRLMLDENNK
jgi:transcriptional regulator with XRE-family HTH domain